MGLAGVKNRRKIGSDPNNTAWSRDTERFGHKVLTGLGWKPGATLGKKDMPYSLSHSPASMSHIRAILKDDQLGLGARHGKMADAEFGLDIFASVLNRLNGKSEKELLEAEELARDKKVARHAAMKLGTMTFVSGGYLVGNSIEKLAKKEAIAKAAATRDEEISIVEARAKKLKRKRSNGNEDDTSSRSIEKTEKKSRRKSSREDEEISTPEKEAKAAHEASLSSESPLKTERRRRREERKAMKEERRLRREKRRKRKQDAANIIQESDQEEQQQSDKGAEVIAVAGQPAANSTFPAVTPRGRHVVRSRFIQQKRMATLDAQALNEIFMIKSAS